MTFEDDVQTAKKLAYEVWLPAAFGPDWIERGVGDRKFRLDEMVWAFFAGWSYGAGRMEGEAGDRSG